MRELDIGWYKAALNTVIRRQENKGRTIISIKHHINSDDPLIETIPNENIIPNGDENVTRVTYKNELTQFCLLMGESPSEIPQGLAEFYWRNKEDKLVIDETKRIEHIGILYRASNIHSVPDSNLYRVSDGQISLIPLGLTLEIGSMRETYGKKLHYLTDVGDAYLTEARTA